MGGDLSPDGSPLTFYSLITFYSLFLAGPLLGVVFPSASSSACQQPGRPPPCDPCRRPASLTDWHVRAGQQVPEPTDPPRPASSPSSSLRLCEVTRLKPASGKSLGVVQLPRRTALPSPHSPRKTTTWPSGRSQAVGARRSSPAARRRVPRALPGVDRHLVSKGSCEAVRRPRGSGGRCLRGLAPVCPMGDRLQFSHDHGLCNPPSG